MIDRNVIQIFKRTTSSVSTYKIDLAPLTNGREGAVSDYLPTGVTISSATVTLSSADWTKDSDALADSNTSVIFTISGGSTVIGAACYVDVHVVLSDGDEDDFSVKLVTVARKSV